VLEEPRSEIIIVLLVYVLNVIHDDFLMDNVQAISEYFSKKWQKPFLK
jgi:hypothetical protein